MLYFTLYNIIEWMIERSLRMVLILYLFYVVISRFTVIICHSVIQVKDAYALSGNAIDTNNTNNATTNINLDKFKFPVFFDARMKWGNMCPSIGIVSNQGRCRSGWAIAIAGTLTDRRCIQSFGNTNLPLSAMMLLSCCPNCCGCGGGHMLNAWKYVRDTGLVTGSMSEKKILTPEDGCQPFRIRPLRKNDLYQSSTQSHHTPTCFKKKCTNPNYQIVKEKPTYFKINHFKLFSRNNSEAIMSELLKNGPLQVSFSLYEDFRDYKAVDGKCPIYIHIWGKREGEHSGKLIGWGTQNKIKYWLVINSFSENWGCNGTFKVPRNGDNNMNFGYIIVAPSFTNDSISLLPITILQWILLLFFYIKCTANSLKT